MSSPFSSGFALEFEMGSVSFTDSFDNPLISFTVPENKVQPAIEVGSQITHP